MTLGVGLPCRRGDLGVDRRLKVKTALRVLRLMIWAAAISVSILCLVPGPASAARPCHSIDVGAESSTARVATVRAGCEVGREVAAEVYREIEERGQRAGVPRFNDRGFGCQVGLAESELFCRRGREWIFASTQVADRPDEWNPPAASRRSTRSRSTAGAVRAFASSQRPSPGSERLERSGSVMTVRR